MKGKLLVGEVILKEGMANMERGVEAVGGKLYLTNLRLLFEAHKFNVQSGGHEIKLDSITDVSKCWTRFLGLIPFIPNSIAVVAGASNYRFCLYGRKNWLKEIAEAQGQTTGNPTLSQTTLLPDENDLKRCPHCAEEIKYVASKCKHCKEQV